MDPRVAVRHLDETVVVIQKPSGMMSMRHVAELDWPAAKRKLQPSADEVILRRISQILRDDVDLSALPAALRRKHLRSVHRLDRDTSGLLVFARTVEAEQNLVSQFAAHSITRTYVAVVCGTPIEQTIRNRLVRDRGDGLRGSTQAPDDGKPAATHIRLLETWGEYTLVECQLESGRTHQIRIHLAEQGQPVCGDELYRGPINGPVVEDSSNAPRLALHARVLEFEHPQTGERIGFEAELPDDLASFIDRLRTDQ
jgi:23S rRNA pseudouridine1911/1915/1917 synthase